MTIRLLQTITILLAFACGAFGDTITFTDSSTGTGMIGATSFTDAAFTITGIGNTTNVSHFSAGLFINLLSASISISGVGNFQFTTPTRFFVSGTLVGFSRAGASGLDLLNGPKNPIFTTWNMQTSIGPVSGYGGILQWSLSPVVTSGGILVFKDAAVNITFKAAVVPELGSIILCGTGFTGIFGIWFTSHRKRSLISTPTPSHTACD